MAISRQVGAMALLLALAACGKGGKDGNLAALDDQLTNNAADPAVKGALADDIVVDPSLVGQSNRNAVRSADRAARARRMESFQLMAGLHRTRQTHRGLVAHHDAAKELPPVHRAASRNGKQRRNHRSTDVEHAETMSVIKLGSMGMHAVDQRCRMRRDVRAHPDENAAPSPVRQRIQKSGASGAEQMAAQIRASHVVDEAHRRLLGRFVGNRVGSNIFQPLQICVRNVSHARYL